MSSRAERRKAKQEAYRMAAERRNMESPKAPLAPSALPPSTVEAMPPLPASTTKAASIPPRESLPYSVVPPETPKNQQDLSANVSRTSADTHQVLVWMRRLAGVPIFLTGIRMIADNYWVGIALACFGLLWLFLEVWFGKWFQRPRLRYVALGVVLMVTVVCGCRYILFSAPITVLVSASDVNYGDGIGIDGILWGPGLSELRLSVTNETDLDYKNMEVSVRTDRLATKVVCVGACPTCTVAYPIGPMDNASLTPVTGPGGQPTGEALPVRIFGVNAFTIRCGQIQHHTQIRVFAATAVPEKPITIESNGKVYHEYSIAGKIPSERGRSKAEHVSIGAIYTARGKLFRVEIPKALKQQEH